MIKHTDARLFLTVLVAYFLPSVLAAVDADEVSSLPGWAGKLPSKHYSGNLPGI